MAKIVCDICDASFDDEGLDKCPVCGSELPKNDEPITEESALVADEEVEVEEAPIEEPAVEEENVDTQADEELKPTGEFEYSAPFSEAPELDEDVAAGIYDETVRMMESVTAETPYIVFKKIADKLESISGYKNSDDLRKVCLEKAEILRKEGLYKTAVTLESSSDTRDVEKAILTFVKIIDYKDSREHITLCNEKLELLGDQSVEAEIIPVPVVKEKKIKEKKIKVAKPKAEGKKIPLAAIISGAVALVVAIALLTIFLIVPTIKYGNATNLLERGKYNEAYSAFGEIDEFRNSKERMEVIVVLYAMEKGSSEDASEEEINDIISSIHAEDHDVVVTYNYGFKVDGSYKTEVSELSYKDEFSGIVKLTREGYEFVKYEIEDFGFKDGKVNLKLKATWDGDYSIKVDLDGGVNKGSNGKEIEYPDEYSFADAEDIVFVNPTRDGYTFAGWSGSDITGMTMELKLQKGSFGDKEYKANWTANEYNVTYDANGGSVSVTGAKVLYGSDYVMPIPEKTGYTFKGWADPNGKIIEQTDAWSVANDVALKAVWEYEVYHITYNGVGSEDENPNSATFIIGSSNIKLKTPKRDGYTFKGWYSDAKFSTKITQIDTSVLQDVTIYAKWEIVTYNIVYEAEGTIAKKYLTFTVEDLPFKLPADDGEDDFKCWVDEEYKEISKIETVGDVIIRAKYYDSNNKINYIKEEDGYVVYSYSGTATKVDLSKKYNGSYIVGIFDGAFENATKLTEVVIGPSVKFIGASAFEGCTKLDTVTIPESVERIGKNAFLDCDSDLVIDCLASSKPSGWDKKWYGDSDYEFAA